MSQVKVVAENVELSEIDPRRLTSDCHTVTREDGVVDVVKSTKRVSIFDIYHDLGIRIRKIELSGGVLNPKNHKLGESL
jgi:hypothetical protein